MKMKNTVLTIREFANRFWRVLVQSDRVFKEFRSRFCGKCSPVHFFWGSFDLAVTRFSGRPAPPHPGGIPHLARCNYARGVFTGSEQPRFLAGQRRCADADFLFVCLSGASGIRRSEGPTGSRLLRTETCASSCCHTKRCARLKHRTKSCSISRKAHMTRPQAGEMGPRRIARKSNLSCILRIRARNLTNMNPGCAAEQAAWRELKDGWRPLYGDVDKIGVASSGTISVIQHSFDWGRSFHPQ